MSRYPYAASAASNEKEMIWGQWPVQVIWSQLNNLVPRERIQGYNNICVMTVTVNLPSIIRNQYVLTRTVKTTKVLLCGQWSHKWICSQRNQQYNYNLVSRRNMDLYVVTRTVNLQDATRNLNTLSVTRMSIYGAKEAKEPYVVSDQFKYFIKKTSYLQELSIY